MWMYWRVLMQVIAGPYWQFTLLYLGFTVQDGNYLKEIIKYRLIKKGALPTLEANTVLDIFIFTSDDIKTLWLLV